MHHPVWFALLLSGLGVGVTVIYGGLAVAGVVRRRLGWCMIAFGMILTVASSCGLVWLLWDAGLAWWRGVPELWQVVALVGALMLLFGCLAVGWLSVRHLQARSKLRRQRRQEATGSGSAQPAPATPPEIPFSSDGLEFQSRGQDGWRIMVEVTTDRPLPQPLELRLRCSADPTDVYASLWLESRTDTRELSRPIPTIEGKEVFFRVKEPMFKPFVVLRVVLCVNKGDRISVDLAEWRPFRPC
jgi:hypothetical protein